MNPRLLWLLALLLLASSPFAEAQQPTKVPRVGYLTSAPLSSDRIESFRQGLRELGYVEGKDIVIEFRSYEGKQDRQRALAAELARLKVDVIIAVGSGDIRSVKEATATIPIIMVQGGDVVRSGFVASLARPGGNITGLATPRPGAERKTARGFCLAS